MTQPTMQHMTQRAAPAGPDRLILVIKGAYWVALLIIAAMALASYLLLQQTMAAQQKDQRLQTLVGTQRTLSQRIVFLANAAKEAPLKEKRPLVAALRAATAEFEASYDTLLSGLDLTSDGSLDAKPGTVDNILYGAPHHLDFFSVSLVAMGSRFAAAIESDILALAGKAQAGAIYPAARDERARLDARVANAALDAYSVLRDHLAAGSEARLQGMLVLHRNLFYATIALIVLIALFIFRPMAEAIARRTRDLIDARNAMAFLAGHDSLTGLYNRSFLADHFPALLKAAERRGERVAVIQFDLDRFKAINDTLGHAAGDAVLVTTAARMREACGASDACVRLGGDEFIMVLNDAGHASDLGALAQRVLARVNEAVPFGGATIAPGASAGIAVFPLDGENAADLVTHADLALYAAKKLGGNACSFFSGELRRELEHRREMEAELKAAVEAESFEAFFQPQVALVGGRTTGIEALMRWTHASRGQVAPGVFMPIAEKSGLMAQIGRIVVGKAIRQAAAWHRAGIPFGRLAVNVSGTELQDPDFNAFLFQALAEAGLPPEKLSLEIVESVMLDDEKTGIAAKLRAIRAAGVNLELDDFGTGYASLLHVNPQEIDRLKIDRRFVRNIDANGDNAKIVRALCELARGLGIAVIAEGAETAAELDALAGLGCGEVQGYAVAFPMPAAAAGEWLAQRIRGSVRGEAAEPAPLRAGAA